VSGAGRMVGEQRCSSRSGPDRLEFSPKPDGFAAEAIAKEAARLGTSVEELVSFAVLYYLADLDSGRVARQIYTQSRVGGSTDRPVPENVGSDPTVRRTPCL
jgi:hypothetical protein